MTNMDELKTKISDQLETSTAASNIGRTVGVVAAVIILIIGILGFLWDSEPGLFDVNANAVEILEGSGITKVTGSTTVTTMIKIVDDLLHKRGGYLSNDIMPPGVWMDNVPNWEFGVLVQVRDMARTLRNNLSRSQSSQRKTPVWLPAKTSFISTTTAGCCLKRKPNT